MEEEADVTLRTEPAQMCPWAKVSEHHKQWGLRMCALSLNHAGDTVASVATALAAASASMVCRNFPELILSSSQAIGWAIWGASCLHVIQKLIPTPRSFQPSLNVCMDWLMSNLGSSMWMPGRFEEWVQCHPPASVQPLSLNHLRRLCTGQPAPDFQVTVPL